MKSEWWYDDATFHYSSDTELRFAQLTVNDDGSAQVVLPGNRREFASEEDASVWLVDEEYRRLDDLIADLKEGGIPVDPCIKAPAATVPEDQMVIKLKTAPQNLSSRLVEDAAWTETGSPLLPGGKTGE